MHVYRLEMWNSALTDAFSVGFGIGYLTNVNVVGLGCKNSGPRSCKVCEKACRYFPLNQVLKFTDKGFRGGDGICVGSKSQYFHDICLGSSMVEMLVQLNLLGRGSQYEIASDEGNPLYVVEYTQHDIRELKQILLKMPWESLG